MYHAVHDTNLTKHTRNVLLVQQEVMKVDEFVFLVMSDIYQHEHELLNVMPVV